MDLLNKIKKKTLAGGLAAVLAVSGGLFLSGCGSYRDENQRVSYCIIPSLFYAFKTEKFKKNSNKIQSATEVLITKRGCDLKSYGKKMEYQGLWRAKTQKDSNNLLVEHYDSQGRLIKSQEGLSDDAPVLIMVRLD